MSDPVNQAAEAAIAGFWNEQGREDAAAREVLDVPAGTGTALSDEYAQQQASLVEDGSVDPEQPDGIPALKTEIKPQATGKPAQTATSGETPADESGLDPVLRSIAEEAGWDKEKIDKLYEMDPAFAEEVFGKLADQYAETSRQFLTAPGSQPVVAQTQPAQVPVQQQTALSSALPQGLTDESLAKFALENGEQSANLIKQVRDHFIGQNSALEKRVQAFEAKANEAEVRAVAQEANTVLSGLREKFPKLYGKSEDPKALTLAEHQKVVELVSMADQLRAGAVAQGRTLSVGDAMKRAHYIVSHASTKAEARQEIAATLKHRAKTATARPTQRTNPKVALGEKKSDQAAMEAFSQKAAEIGLSDLIE